MARRRTRRRTRRRYYRPRRRYSRNPARRIRVVGRLRRLTSPETFRITGWGTAGAIGARMIPGLFLARFDSGWIGWLMNASTALILGGLVRPLIGAKAATYVTTGGLIATGIRISAETLLAGRTPFGEYVLEGAGAGEYVPEPGEISGVGNYGGNRWIASANAF